MMNEEEKHDEEINDKKRWSVKTIILSLLVLSFLVYLIVDALTTRHVTRLTTKFLEAIEDFGFFGIVLLALFTFLQQFS